MQYACRCTVVQECHDVEQKGWRPGPSRPLPPGRRSSTRRGDSGQTRGSSPPRRQRSSRPRGPGTRGALYHHFADREELFLAVFDAVQEELTTSLTPTKIDEVDPITRVRKVLLVFLDLVAERPDAQALLIDGPAVFGWRRWRELESQRGLAAIENLLEAAVHAGQIAAHLVQPLAALLLGLMTDAALLVATSEDPARARASTADAFAMLLDGLRTPLPG